MLAPYRSHGYGLPVLPFGYRHAVASMFYHRLINAEPRYKNLHDSNDFKFFTFSRLEVPRRKVVRGGLKILSNDAYLWFSSVNDGLAKLIAKNLIKEPLVDIAGVNFRVVEIRLFPGIRINPDSNSICHFTTLSPILLRTITDDGDRRRTWNVTPDDPDFAERLVKNLERKYTDYYGTQPQGSVRVVDISRTKRKRIEIDKIYHIAYLMDVSLEGHPELLEFAYDCGLGEKNSMGFGMIRQVSGR